MDSNASPPPPMAAAGAPAQSGAVSAVPPVDDAALLRLIAQERDKDAFTQLLKEHKSAMYSLAMMLTNDGNVAEDALQEAAIRIWRFAGTYRPSGSARSWVLRIVARECLRKTMRKARKEIAMDQEEMQLQREFASLSDGPDAESQSETNELLALLRKALMGLQADERQLMALAFGADLTHAEIGYEIALPRRSVSKRIAAIIDKLRNTFKSNGQAAVIPLLTPEFLSRAICKGAPAPHGLLAKLLAGASVAARSARMALPAASKGTTLLKLLAGLVALLLLVGALIFWSLTDRTDVANCGGAAPSTLTAPPSAAGLPTTPPSPPVTPPAAVTAPQPMQADASGFTGGKAGAAGVARVEYDFSNSIPSDLQFTSKPQWRAAGGGNPGRLELALGGVPFTGILFPEKLPANRPVQVTVHFWVTQGAAGFSMMRARNGTIPTQTHWFNDSEPHRPKARDVLMTYYLYKEYSICCLDTDNGSVIVSVQQYQTPVDGDQLALSTNALTVTHVTMELVDEKDLPKQIREIEKRIPTYRKMGTHEDQAFSDIYSNEGQKVTPTAP